MVVQEGLLTWWTEMNARVRGLPSEASVGKLFEALQVATERRLQVVSSDVPAGVLPSLAEAVGLITTDVFGARCSVRIGADAAIGILADTVGLQRRHSAALYKYPRTTTRNSIPVNIRREMLPDDGFCHHKPTRSTREGNDVGMLFSVMLWLMKRDKYLERIIPCVEYPIPKASLDSKHFHHVFWKKLVTPEYNWLEMSIRAREDRFFEFLFQLFTVDPSGKSMQPAFGSDPRKRNNACWNGFSLTDDELLGLVRESISIYVDTKPEF
jgi:hypothetical protein